MFPGVSNFGRLAHSPGMTELLALRLGGAAARRMAPGHPDVDDIAQEAALRVAQVAEQKPDATVSYLAGAARMRVRDLLRGKPWTGQDGTQAAPRDPLRRGDAASLDGLGGEDESRLTAVLDVELDRVEWRALRAELDAAIASIPVSGAYAGQRRETPRAVSRLVMAGLTPSEAGRRLGLSDTAGRKAWADVARPHLAHQLDHLKELVA